MDRTSTTFEEISLELRDTVQDVLNGSITRVIVDKDLYGVSPRRAREQYRITPDVVFIRADHWTLGAPIDLASLAHFTWPKEWVAVVNMQTKCWVPYDDDWEKVLTT